MGGFSICIDHLDDLTLDMTCNLALVGTRGATLK